MILEKITVTTKELCALTNTDKHYWYMVEKVGAIKPILIGRKKQWLVEDIKEYLEWAKTNEVNNEFNLIKSLARKEQYDRRSKKG